MRGKRCAELLLLPMMCLGAVTVAAQDAPPVPTAAPSPPVVMVVLDASRGMWAKVGGTSKVGLVRNSLGKAINAYQDKIAFGLVAFGHRPAASCASTQTIAKPGELDAKTQSKLLFGFKPKGDKPVAASLQAAAEAAKGNGGPLDIVLITDGPDGCKADMCTTAQALKQTIPGLRIHVLAFPTKAGDEAKALSCIAEASGGEFITATNAEALSKGLDTILAAVALPRAPAATAAASPPGGTAPAPASAPLLANAPAASAGPGVPVPSEGAAQAEPPPTAPAPSASAEPPAGATAPQAAASQSDVPKSPSPPQIAAPKSASPAPGRPDTTAQATPLPPAQPLLPVPVTLHALLTEGGPKVQSGLIWRVFTNTPGPNGQYKLVSTHREAMPTAALLPGEYFVNAAYGLSNLTKKIKVESGRSVEETFVLNAGGLKLSAALANGEPLPPGSVHFDILSDEEDQFGNRHTILGDAKPDIVIRLNAGAYHIVSHYGDANATVRADVTVEPGKVTDARIKHAASKITFKLVQSAGGEALADTQWTLLTKTGDVVKETAGALPSCILAAGSYAVVARHADASYTQTFDVGTGESKQVEVAMEYGPATPEALRAVTNPPPPPAATADGAGEAPSGPDAGLGFGGQAAPASPSGPLLNPGALLHPKLN
jgi:hypothetical protein